MNLGDFLLINAERYPRKTAILVDGEARTYKALNSRVNRLANSLIQRGLGKGDLVGILSPNSVAWVEALYAVFKTGATAVPVNFRLREHEILNELKRTNVSALFISDDHVPVVGAYRAVCDRNVAQILLGDGQPEGILSMEALISGAPDHEPGVRVGEEDVAAILFTGGTTGLPKGALCTHRMLIWTTVNCMTAYETPRPDHIMLHPFPLFHSSGIFRVVSYLSAGATYLTVGGFDAEACLNLIERHGVTSFIGSSAVFLPMHEIQIRRRADTASVTNCVATFAFMDSGGRNRLKELFPNAAVYEGYGSTEAGPVCALGANQAPQKKGSVGKPSICTRIKIVDEGRNPLPPGETGEIVVRGPHVATGYHDNPRETEAAFREEWFYTGDMGRIDDDGFLYVVDRKKDMIKTGGENVYSREVEEMLLRHPAVKEAAVIGVPHERWGETIRAIVVAKEGRETSEQELIDFCKSQAASYKKPTSVVFAASIPKTETGGKVSKWMLREQYGRR
jgi:fatty-acyl-CoA synthase